MESKMNAAELAENLVTWIREKVLSGGSKGTVLGMSGGVDSSVAAVLCQRACPQSAIGVLMPCHSILVDEEHALAVAEKFSIQTRKVILDSVFDSLLHLLPNDNVDMDTGRLARANLKPRLRMLTLYYIANQLDYMVVGSSNRSELAIGYFTKWGDGGVDIMPLGNLVKGQVKELASYLGIPQEIIDKPPSAGLWAGQTDESDMGFSYDGLDRYLLTGQAPDNVKGKIESMIAASNHKRTLPLLPAFQF
jgi:NAD+ synthase